MNYIDVFIFVAGAVAFILGFKDGFVRKLIGTIGFFVAIFLGIKLSSTAGKAVTWLTGIEPEFAAIIGGFSVFLLVLLITAVLKRVIHPFDKVSNLINRIVGGIVGTIQMLFFISALFYILSIFKFPSKENQKASLLYSTTAGILPYTINLLNKITPAAKETIPDIINDKDSLR